MKSLAVLLFILAPVCFADPAPIPMRSQYEGEHLRKQDPVHYLDEAQLPQYEVVFRDGKLWGADGAVLNSYQWDLPSIYVITEDQKLFISRYQKHNQFHHSSLSAGKKVLAAGQILVKEGEVLALDRQSGHYFPTEAHLQFTREFLEGKGVALKNTVIGLKTAEENMHLLKSKDCLHRGLGSMFLD